VRAHDAYLKGARAVTQPGSGSSINMNDVPRNDLILIGLGILTLIFGFFPFVGVSGFGHTFTSSGWSGLGLLAELCVLAATVLVVIDVFARQVLPRTLPWNVIIAGLAVLAVVLFIIKLLTHHLCVLGTCGSSGVDVKIGGILTTIAAAAFAVCSFLRFRSSGESLPWATGGSSGSAGGGGTMGGGTGPGPMGGSSTGPTSPPPPAT
jgi:hypothetical protein